MTALKLKNIGHRDLETYLPTSRLFKRLLNLQQKWRSSVSLLRSLKKRRRLRKQQRRLQRLLQSKLCLSNIQCIRFSIIHILHSTINI